MAEVRLVNTVDFGELDTVLLQLRSGLLVVGSEGLAMTTPVG